MNIFLIANTHARCRQEPLSPGDLVVRFNHCASTNYGTRTDYLFLRQAAHAKYTYFGIDAVQGKVRIVCGVPRVGTLVLLSGNNASLPRMVTRSVPAVSRILYSEQTPYTMEACDRRLGIVRPQACSIGAHAALYFRHMFPNASIKLVGFTFHGGRNQMWHNFKAEKRLLRHDAVC